ncbi:TPA: response regulator transcription factor [Clostridioides difficile]|nr:response regulator transcription factor [Clostridioides difficile]
MKRATSHEEAIQRTFDSYCKRILKNEAIDIQRHKKYLNEHEVSLSDIMAEYISDLGIWDEYSTDYTNFNIMGYDVKIKNELLSEALLELNEEERYILLLYSIGFSDKEIADFMKLVRRTVNYKRNKGLKKVKDRMEGKQYEQE